MPSIHLMFSEQESFHAFPTRAPLSPEANQGPHAETLYDRHAGLHPPAAAAATLRCGALHASVGPALSKPKVIILSSQHWGIIGRD
jgi:hypothetical protein